MSFATGLFSFMGGMSQQYREEVDAKRASDAAAAAAAADHVKWQAEQDFEKEKFETGKEQFQTTQSFLESKELREATTERGKLLFDRQKEKTRKKEVQEKLDFDKEKFKFEEFKWESEFDEKKRATASKEELRINKFNLDENIFKLDEEKVKIQVQQFADKLGLSKDELALQYDELEEKVRHNMKTEEIDHMEAVLDAESGTRTYSGKNSANDIKITPRGGETENERLVNNITAYFDLTNEKVNELSPEGRQDLLQDITADLMLFKNFSYNKEKNIWNNFLPQIAPLLEIDIAQEAFGNVINSMKEDSKQSFKENGVDADLTSLEMGNDMIGSSAISYKKASQEAGFETPDQLVSSLDALMAHNNTVKFYTGDLSPFSSHEKIMTTLKQEGIPLSVLRLTPELDFLQESSFGSIPTQEFYKSMIEKAEEYDIGLDALTNFIYKVMPEGEGLSGNIQTGGIRTIQGMGLNIDIKGADSQAKAAGTAIQTIDQLINLINSTDRSNFGMPLKAASIIEKGRNTYQGMTNLISKILSNDDDNPWRDGVDKQSIVNKLEAFKNDIGQNDTIQGMAADNARLQYLKFSLAYQMSMALQGGSGGRTISDQDVDNMLKALQMDGLMNDAAQVRASLGTIREFMVGIRNIAKFEALGSTKGYRAREHTMQLMDAMNIVNEEKLAKEMDEKHYQIGESQNLGGNVNMQFYGKSDGFKVDLTKEGIPVYVKMEGYRTNPKEAYVMSQGEFEEFVRRADAEGTIDTSKFKDDGKIKVIPQYSMGTIMYQGLNVNKTYSDLITPQPEG